MPNSTNTTISVKEAINTQKYKITCIIGKISQEGIDNLEEKIAGILVSINSNHFEEGRTNGHRSVIISMEEYCNIIDDNAWNYNPPIDINAYNPTIVNATAALRAVKKA